MNKYYICKLHKNEYKILKKNPHCIQYFCEIDRIQKSVWPLNKMYIKRRTKYNHFYYYSKERKGKKIKEENLPNVSFKDFKRKKIFKTTDDIKKNATTYTPRGQRPSTTIHLGQLKLSLSTIQFLLYYAPKDKDVHIIYPGSAHGYNIQFLTTLFPQCKWHLIDPGKFYKKLYKNQNIVDIKNTLFTDDLVEQKRKELEDKYKLLISDIRLNPSDEDVDRDNKLQESWVKNFKPHYAQLKWRVPRHKGNKYKYFDGINYLQMFAPPASTETRLVVKANGKIKTKTWDYEEEDNIMYYFNRILKPSYYKTNIKHKCTDHCHDCVAMINLLIEYKEKYPENKFSKQSITKMVEQLFNEIQNVKLRICNDFKKTLKNLK